jgi:3-hydroxyacyl-CoA dehydrogenase
MPLLEIARTAETDDATTATAVAVGKELKKTMVIVKDSQPLSLTDYSRDLWVRSPTRWMRGTPYEIADAAMAPLGLPMSSLQLLGLVGPGVALHVAQTLHTSLGDRYRISPTMQAFVAHGIRSFYIKDADGKQIANPQALALIKSGDKASTAEELRLRALRALASEARMMIDEGVVATPSEIDLCMLLGSGWPMHLGGILPYLDREGISDSVTGSRFHPAGIASLPH